MVCWLLKFRHEIDGWKMMCVCFCIKMKWFWWFCLWFWLVLVCPRVKTIFFVLKKKFFFFIHSFIRTSNNIWMTSMVWNTQQTHPIPPTSSSSLVQWMKILNHQIKKNLYYNDDYYYYWKRETIWKKNIFMIRFQ